MALHEPPTHPAQQPLPAPEFTQHDELHYLPELGYAVFAVVLAFVLAQLLILPT